ncbi:MAG: DUF4286 family protein [Alphaproteobacteria bacterium]|nr:DUF4286 family protein [Alphaproteobacteria bacterium]MBU0859325.1 DUF4286 family protein [Alphaproteobacteria bacterium]
MTPAIAYTVICNIATDEKAAAWVNWLQDGHMAAVMAGGASSATLSQRDDADSTGTTYEVRYFFPSRAVFDHYVTHHAPALRAEGLALFPPTDGFIYSRTIAEVIVTI